MYRFALQTENYEEYKSIPTHMMVTPKTPLGGPLSKGVTLGGGLRWGEVRATAGANRDSNLSSEARSAASVAQEDEEQVYQNESEQDIVKASSFTTKSTLEHSGDIPDFVSTNTIISETAASLKGGNSRLFNVGAKL